MLLIIQQASRRPLQQFCRFPCLPLQQAMSANQKVLLSTSAIRKDIDSAPKNTGAGAANTAVAGSGSGSGGIGNVFSPSSTWPRIRRFYTIAPPPPEITISIIEYVKQACSNTLREFQWDAMKVVLGLFASTLTFLFGTVISFFVLLWSFDKKQEKRNDKFELKIEKAMDTKLDAQSKNFDTKLDAQAKNFDAKLDALAKNFDAFDAKFNTILEKIDALPKA